MRGRRLALPGSLLLALVLVSSWASSAPEAEGSHDPNHRHDPTSTRPFDDIDRWVEVFDAPERDAWQKPAEIVEALGLAPGMTIADIGAGTGYFERHFSRAVGANGRVYAVDTERKMVDYMRDRAVREETPNVTPVLATPDDPLLPDGEIDMVFICDTFHHIGNRVEYISRLENDLAAGGIVVVVDFKKGPIPVGPPEDHKLSREDVIGEFEEAGWALSRESDVLPYQYFLFFSPEESGAP